MIITNYYYFLYEKAKFILNGKLNVDILKTISGKFTTELIFMLDLSK